MFNKLKIWISLCLLFGLNSCVEVENQIDFTSEKIQLDSKAQIDVLLVKATEKSKFSNAINQIIEDSIKANIYPENNYNSLIESLKGFDKEYINFKNDFPTSNQVWELSVESELIYKSEEVVTVSINIYSFTGGAHGNDEILLMNFSPLTGKIITIDELISDKPSFTKVAENYFIKALNADRKELTIEDYFYGEPFHLPKNIGFSEDGIILLYNVYEIASYAQGYTEFAIPLEEVLDYISLPL